MSGELIARTSTERLAPMAVESPYEWQRVRTLFWWRPAEAEKNRSANRWHAADLQRTAGIASQKIKVPDKSNKR